MQKLAGSILVWRKFFPRLIMLFSLLANLFVLANLLALPYASSSVIDVSAYGQNNRAEVQPVYYRPGGPYRLNQDSLGMKVTARAAVVADGATGAVLWQKNPQQPLPIASLTKLLSALVMLENNPGWDTEVTILGSDLRSGGRSYIYQGEQLIVKDLFYLSLVPSANTAVTALARSTGLSQQEFVAEMNKKALALGMSDSWFAEPTGLSPENAASAADLIKLAQAAFARPEIRQASITQNYSFKILNNQRVGIVKNTDKLLGSYLNIGAGKTGSLDEAGYCLISEVIGLAGQKVLVVVLGSSSDIDRFQDLKALAQWAFDNYSWSHKTP